MINSLSIFTDGGARGNPGKAAVGVYIIDQDQNPVVGFGKKIGIATNNIAEYQAVLEAFYWLEKNKQELDSLSSVNFFLDSNLVCSQIKGVFKIKNEKLREMFFSVREIEKKIGVPISYTHIPREKNTKADGFVNMALDKPDK